MLGTHIQRLRQERKLTLIQLAKKTQISKSYLSSIERNIQTNPSIEVLIKIAAVLEVDVQTLLSQNNPGAGLSNTKKCITDWEKLIKSALLLGVINENDLHDITIAIQKEKKC